MPGRCRPSPTATSTSRSSGRTGSARSAGLTTPDTTESAVKRAMIRAARRSVVLADHTKVGQDHLSRFAALDEIDTLITDSGLDAQVADELRSRGPEGPAGMIVTLTLNPSVDRTVEVETLARGEVMRALRRPGRSGRQGHQRLAGAGGPRPADARGRHGRRRRGRASRRRCCGTPGSRSCRSRSRARSGRTSPSSSPTGRRPSSTSRAPS